MSEAQRFFFVFAALLLAGCGGGSSGPSVPPVSRMGTIVVVNPTSCVFTCITASRDGEVGVAICSPDDEISPGEVTSSSFPGGSAYAFRFSGPACEGVGGPVWLPEGGEVVVEIQEVLE